MEYIFFIFRFSKKVFEYKMRCFYSYSSTILRVNFNYSIGAVLT